MGIGPDRVDVDMNIAQVWDGVEEGLAHRFRGRVTLAHP